MYLGKENRKFWTFCYKWLHTPVTSAIILSVLLAGALVSFPIYFTNFTISIFILPVSMALICYLSFISIFVTGATGRGGCDLCAPSTIRPITFDALNLTPGGNIKILNNGGFGYLAFTATATGSEPQRIQVSNQGTFNKDIRLDVNLVPGTTKTYFVDTSDLVLGRISFGPNVVLTNFLCLYYTLDHYCPSPAFKDSIIRELTEEVKQLPVDRAMRILNQIKSSRGLTKDEVWKQDVFKAFTKHTADTSGTSS